MGVPPCRPHLRSRPTHRPVRVGTIVYGVPVCRVSGVCPSRGRDERGSGTGDFRTTNKPTKTFLAVPTHRNDTWHVPPPVVSNHGSLTTAWLPPRGLCHGRLSGDVVCNADANVDVDQSMPKIMTSLSLKGFTNSLKVSTHTLTVCGPHVTTKPNRPVKLDTSVHYKSGRVSKVTGQDTSSAPTFGWCGGGA